MRFATVILIVLCTGIAVAQNGGTIESRFGIGELNTLTTVRQNGMGGIGTSLLSEYDISQGNPATWTAIDQLRLSIGLNFEYLDVSNLPNSIATGAIKGFQFVLPLEETYKMRLSAGVMPFSRSEYSAVGTQYIDDDEYRVFYQGNGGLSLFRAGIAFSPIDRISIGAAFHYFFGAIEQSWELEFAESGYYPGSQKRVTNHSGTGVLLGVQYQGPMGISLGAAVSPAVSIPASRNLVFSYSTRDSTVSGASGTQELPLEFRIGAGWRMNDELLVAAEYRAQDWTEATVFDKKQSRLGQAYIFGVGVEWQPYVHQTDSRTLSKTVFRFGAAITQPYISIQDSRNREVMITVGSGFPIFGSSRADLALGYGWRGVNDKLLGKQQIFRASLGVSVGESWFIRNRE